MLLILLGLLCQAKFSVSVKDAGFKEDVILDVDGSRICGILLRNFHGEGYRRVRVFRCMQNWMREVVFAGSTAGQFRTDQGLECFNDEVASTAKTLAKSLQKPLGAPTPEDIMIAVQKKLGDDEVRGAPQVEAEKAVVGDNDASAGPSSLGLVQDLLKTADGEKEEEADDEVPKAGLMGRQLVPAKPYRNQSNNWCLSQVVAVMIHRHAGRNLSQKTRRSYPSTR